MCGDFGGGMDSGSSFSSSDSSSSGCYSPSMPDVSTTPSTTHESHHCSPNSDLFNGQNIDYLVDIDEPTGTNMAIQFDRLQNAGAHAQTLDFSKAQAVATGQRINFGKDNPNVKNIRAELYWKGDADGDAAILLLDTQKVALPGVTDAERQRPTGPNGTQNPNKTKGMVWYNNLEVPGAKHSGDVLSADEDDSAPEETIHIQLDRLDRQANEVLIVASTFPNKSDPQQRPVPFGRLRACKVMIINDDTNEVLYVYELDEDFSQFTSVELASFYKRDGEWRYTSMGEGVGKSAQALSDIAAKYKLS